MGKNNRARRAAKAKARQQRPTTSPRHGFTASEHSVVDDSPSWSVRDNVQMLWSSVTVAATRSEPVSHLLDRLVNLPPATVDRVAERSMVDQLAYVWAGGWQPAELERHAARTTSQRARQLIRLAIAVNHLDLDDAMVDPRWRSQLDALELPVMNRRSSWSAAVLVELPSRSEQIEAFADAIACLAYLPRLDQLIPPPGSDPSATWPPGGGVAAAATGADPIIDKVRNLLAKAESTEYEAEAMAFTAKAHELMTRHAIDTAALAPAGSRDRGEVPVAARVFVDAPYADAKSLLLQVIASATRCRSVFHTGLDLSTVVGFPDDVAAVQLMFTSLLVQAQAALNTAARSAPPGTRTRSQGFRSAFYVAYANRIGERLDESNRVVTQAATAEHGDAFLPVLADRANEVDEVFDARFDSLVNGRVRGGWDAAGWASGKMAADLAQLQYADLTDTDESAVDLTEEVAASLPGLTIGSSGHD